MICSTSAEGKEIVISRNEDIFVIKDGLELVDQVDVGCVGIRGASKVANRLTVPVRD